jgi:hypothetical protein
MASGSAAPRKLALTVPSYAAADGFGKLSQDDCCVMFKYSGTALTNVCVASGVRVAFILLNKGSHWGTVGTAPIAAAEKRDFSDHEGAVGLFSDGGLSAPPDCDKRDVLPGYNEGDLIVLEGLPDCKACMWVNGNKQHEWRVNEGDRFAVSGANGTSWRLREAPSSDAPVPPPRVPSAPQPQQPSSFSFGSPAAASLPPAPPELLEAANKGKAADIERLIADGADVSHPAPVHAAASRGHVKVLDLLLAAGANKEAHLEVLGTPMHAAARSGQVKAVQALLEAGADIEARTKGPNMQTPLHVAASAGHDKVVQLLCASGAEKNARESSAPGYQGATAMHLALGHVKVLKALLASGASDEVLRDDGKTALDVARNLARSSKAFKAAVTLLEKVARERDEDTAKRQRTA